MSFRYTGASRGGSSTATASQSCFGDDAGRFRMGLTALCPGTFDPVTNGHLDIVTRAAQCFDAVIVGVLENPSKQPLFALSERVAMLEEACADLAGVRVSSFDGLLVEYATAQGASAIVKGLRA